MSLNQTHLSGLCWSVLCGVHKAQRCPFGLPRAHCSAGNALSCSDITSYKIHMPLRGWSISGFTIRKEAGQNYDIRLVGLVTFQSMKFTERVFACRKCPHFLKGEIATIIFAAPRCGDLAELQEVGRVAPRAQGLRLLSSTRS